MTGPYHVICSLDESVRLQNFSYSVKLNKKIFIKK